MWPPQVYALTLLLIDFLIARHLVNREDIFRSIEQRGGMLLAAVLVVTALLAIPFLALTPGTQASTDPSGEVFEAAELIDDRLVSPLFTPFFIVEAKDGDMLLKEPLLELYKNEQSLRAAAETDGKLYTYESANYRTVVTGVYTIADAIDQRLKEEGSPGGLADATDETVKSTAHDLLLAGQPTADLSDSFSVLTTQEKRIVNGEEIIWMTVPAIAFPLLADNETLGGGGFTSNLGGDETVIEKEEFSRGLQDELRGQESNFEVWGVAIDANLTSAEEGATAGPFITFTIIAVLIVVGFVLRSYWAVVLVGASLAILMIWLKGLSNLIGLESSIVMSFIVPIAMISFGVDFAFHAVGRYREEMNAESRAPRVAYVAGLTAVSAALLLALFSDSLAFLSNTASGIPSIIQFGIGASIALAAAFGLLGVLVPLALMRIEATLPGTVTSKSVRSRLFLGLRIGAAALTAGFSVLFLVFFPPIGIVALLLYLTGFIAAPLWITCRRKRPSETPAFKPPTAGGSWERAGTVVGAFGRARLIVLPAAGAASVAAVWFALQVEASFDVKDFFSSDSDFVVGLDKIEEHTSSGEPALIYVEGNLTDPQSLQAIRQLYEEVDTSTSGRFGRLNSGELQALTGALEIVDEAMGSPAALAAISAATGTDLKDSDGDGLPDTAAAIEAIYAYSLIGGIPGEQGMLLPPDNIPALLWIGDNGTEATVLTFGLTGTRQQQNIVLARDELEPLVAQLESALRIIDGGAKAQLTGSPIARQEGLDATVRALQTSLPIAVVLCFVVTALFMRSLRYAAVAIVPILLVVTWLYALMYLFGFPLNIVTATIGAISIGVGIDFAVHFTMRYREELKRLGNRLEAVRATGAGTGTALLASALSSIVGFAIMAFAPMPMFATYGVLTAIMIALAATASLVVLPGLLMTVTRDEQPQTAAD